MSVADFVKILEVKRYSPNTIKTYSSFVSLAKGYFKKPLNKVSEQDLYEYIHNLIHHKKISFSYQKQMVMSLKLYYKEVLNETINIQYLIPSRREKKLPSVLSKNEVKRLINGLSNIKHKCIISLMYSAGLRISEVVGLEIIDIDSERMIITVRGAKNYKDRNLPLSEKILLLLREYYKEYSPNKYLFEGQKGGKYTASSIRQTFNRVVKKVGIKKNATPHTLRHSYATHLLEDGVDVRIIQKLLGHNSLNTTMIYTHIATPTLLKVKSPFDTL
jgi:integrase/recombinase XerD